MSSTLNKNHIDSYFFEGACHNELNEKEDALKCFSKVIELNPKNENALQYRGQILLSQKNMMMQ